MLGPNPLDNGKCVSVRSFRPIRSRVGADDPAAGAHHARAEGGYRHVIRPAVQSGAPRRGGRFRQPPTIAATIEIDLAGKYRLRVNSRVDAQALRRVLDVLERR
jgi:hypothetical protein